MLKALVTLICCLLATQAVAADDRTKLVGTWKVVSWVQEFQDGGDPRPEYGKNPITERYPEEADNYGLKLAHLLLPLAQLLQHPSHVPLPNPLHPAHVAAPALDPAPPRVHVRQRLDEV